MREWQCLGHTVFNRHLCYARMDTKMILLRGPYISLSMTTTCCTNDRSTLSVVSLRILIWCVTQLSEDPAMPEHHEDEDLQIGMSIQVLSPTQQWRAASICNINEDTKEVKIHYETFDEQFDEWIPISSARIKGAATSLSRQDSLEFLPVLCSKGHQMTLLDGPCADPAYGGNLGYCDGGGRGGCSKTVNAAEGYYHCDLCKGDACLGCIDQVPSQVESSSRLRVPKRARTRFSKALEVCSPWLAAFVPFFGKVRQALIIHYLALNH